jgi:hypothetical protein
MPLINLHDDVLTLIIGSLLDPIDFRSLRSLSLTSKRLHHLCARFIFQTVDLAPSYYGVERDPQFEQLLRSLEARPVLANMIHRCSITWKDACPALHVFLNNFLRATTQLQELYIYSGDQRCPFYPDFLKENCMPMLRKLDIQNAGYLEAEQLQPYLSIVSLQHLEIWPTIMTESILGMVRVPRMDNVVNFECGSFPEKAFKKLLCAMPNLKRLRCMGPELQYTDWEGTLSPTRMTACLADVCDSLEHLCLFSHRQEWKHHDQSRLDLSHMKRLQTVNIRAGFFFVPGCAIESRKDLFKLLPPSIRTIVVSSEVLLCLLADTHVLILIPVGI